MWINAPYTREAPALIRAARKVRREVPCRFSPSAMVAPDWRAPNLMIFFLPRDWDDAALKAYFESYGAVEHAKVMLDRPRAPFASPYGYIFLGWDAGFNAEIIG